MGDLFIDPINFIWNLYHNSSNSMIKAARPRVVTGVCSMGRKGCTSELTMIKLKHLTQIFVLRNFLQVMTSMKEIRREILQTFCKCVQQCAAIGVKILFSVNIKPLGEKKSPLSFIYAKNYSH